MEGSWKTFVGRPFVLSDRTGISRRLQSHLLNLVPQLAHPELPGLILLAEVSSW